MEVLGGSVSALFQAFHNAAVQELGVPIEFSHLESHFPMNGLSELRADRLLVKVIAGLEGDEHEITLAHEIAHGLIRHRRFPVLAPVNSDDLKDETLTFLGGAIDSVVHDQVVEVVLKDAGFDTEPDSRRYVRSVIRLYRSPDQKPRRGDITYLFEQCRLVRCMLLENAGDLSELRAVCNAEFPGIWGDVRGIATRLKKIGWSTPQQVLQCQYVLVKKMGIDGSHVAVEPITHEVIEYCEWGREID